MLFKQWFTLNENPHATLSQPIQWQGKEIVIVDLRVEDWKINGKNSNETEGFKKQLAMYQFGGYPPFFGRIPNDGRFLYHNGNDSFNFSIVNSMPLDGVNLDSLAINGR